MSSKTHDCVLIIWERSPDETRLFRIPVNDHHGLTEDDLVSLQSVHGYFINDKFVPQDVEQELLKWAAAFRQPQEREIESYPIGSFWDSRFADCLIPIHQRVGSVVDVFLIGEYT